MRNIPFETLKLLVAERRMYLMVPIILYNGFTLSFIFGTMPVLGWEKAFGKRFVPFGTGWFYLINTIATYLIGRYANTPKKQKKVMVMAGVCHIIVFASLILLLIASLKCKPDHPSPCDWLRGTAETPSLLDIAYICSGFLFRYWGCRMGITDTGILAKCVFRI